MHNLNAEKRTLKIIHLFRDLFGFLMFKDVIIGCFVFSRGIQHQTVQELERQVELLRERDGQLQYTVKEQDAKIEALKQKLKNTGDKVVPLNIN